MEKLDNDEVRTQPSMKNLDEFLLADDPPKPDNDRMDRLEIAQADDSMDRLDIAQANDTMPGGASVEVEDVADLYKDHDNHSYMKSQKNDLLMSQLSFQTSTRPPAVAQFLAR